MAEITVHAACPHDCPDTCALRVTVLDGRVTHIVGDPDHPPTQGVLCTKVSRYAERSYHPERVLYPLRRVGPKAARQDARNSHQNGDQSGDQNAAPNAAPFERVSWDEALTDIAARLKTVAAQDPQAVLPYSYAGTMGLVQGESMAARFFNRLGASRLDRTICASAGGEALAATYGARVGMHVEDFAQARLIIIWGSNAIASSVHFWALAQQAKRAGAQLVCIDPRRTETADKCQRHIALRPGTDGALALGLMQIWITEGGLDEAYIDSHVSGWPALRERALAWPPERSAQVCGIDAAALRQLALDWAATCRAGQGVAVRLNYGMQRVQGGGNAVRLIALLPCLTGAWRHAGGGLLLSSSGWFAPAVDSAALERPDLAPHQVPNQVPQRAPRTVNMSTIGDDLLREASPEFGPRIDAVIVYNSNPVAVAPHSSRVAQGFGRDNLFTVVLEHFMTDTAELADYVLPATTQLEHWDVHKSYGHTHALINQPAIAPLGEALPNTEIFRRLAQHMGFDEPCFSDTDEQLVRQAYRPQWVDFEELLRVGWVALKLPRQPFKDGGFFTPDGRAQVCPPGLELPDHVPNHESEQQSPELAARYPLAMISPPARHFLNSTFVNVKSLRSIEGEPLVEVHPDDAAPRGLVSGAWVEVFNDRGSYRCKARVSTRARPGVVNGLGIWWKKFGADGRNVNELTSQRLTDMGRAPTFYDCLVELRAASTPASATATACAAAPLL